VIVAYRVTYRAGRVVICSRHRAWSLVNHHSSVVRVEKVLLADEDFTDVTGEFIKDSK
jgi:hypothetical protein